MMRTWPPALGSGALLVLAAPLLPPTSVQVENVAAFALLYGYVRFFHPSDEASRVDWDKLAVYGASRVRTVESGADLEQALEALFRPLAPTLRVFAEREGPSRALDLRPDEWENLSVVAWQHKGVGLETRGTYDSIRTHRLERRPAAGASFGTITQAAPAAEHRGKKVRLRAAVRTAVEGDGNEGRLWVRVDRAGGAPGFFDNMLDRPIRTDTWTSFEISGDVDEDAERIVFGGFLLGKGSVWLDAFELTVQGSDGTWRSLSLDNADFETESGLVGWNASSPGYAYRVEEGGCYRGSRCARIDVEYELSPPRLFDALPAVGEVVSASLPRGLGVEVPLALYGDDENTYGGRIEPGVTEELLRLVDAVDPDVTDATSRRLGAVVIAWNVFQHFYPYFDVVETDWPGVLNETIRRTLEASDERSFEKALKLLLVELDDGHAGVYRPGVPRASAFLPFAVDWIEQQVVVTATESPEIQRGDVVVSLDGKPAAAILEEGEALVSGSSQWKRFRTLMDFGAGEAGSSVRIVLKRKGSELERTSSRERKELLPEPRPEPLSELADGIYYCDLTRAPFDAIRPRMEDLASAKGVVFDMRGYPRRGNHEILRHLTDEPLRSAQWMVPRTIYPDGENRVGYDTSGQWVLAPSAPRFRGKIVFLTDAGAISYGETVMGIVEHYRLGEIVGQPTAGTNGNVNPFHLPGGYRIFWTGMKVLKHDDSRHHLIGILPTIRVSRSLAAVLDGRDEYLERALELVR